MPLPDTKAVMTPEEEAHLQKAIADLVRTAQEVERDRWMQATEHEHTCEYVQSPQILCTCGAHVRLALLHGEAAYAIRARKANHD